MRPVSRLCTVVFFSLAVVAWGGDASSLMAQNIQVTSATPNSAVQGTINLNVTVGGSGFKRGATAIWYLSGTTNPGGVTVNSTAFNSSQQLTANITVSSTADTGSFDVAVMNTDGRTGKGTGLFSVSIGNGSAPTTCNGINVTSILYDTDSNSVPFQYQSDGLGPYTTYGNTKSNKDSVSSVIQGSCDWALNTTNSTSRGIVVTLAYPDGTNPAPPFIGPQEVHGVFNTSCYANPANNGLSFGTMTFAGQTLQCQMGLSFTFNGVLYALALNPKNWPGSTWMQLTCTGASGGLCNAWTVLPDPVTAVVNTATNQTSAVAELFLPSCNGCGSGAPQGLYLVSFSFLIHQ